MIWCSGVGSGCADASGCVGVRVALLNFLLLCHLPGVAWLVMAMRICCDNLLVLWPLVNWPMLVLRLPLVCPQFLLGEVVVHLLPVLAPLVLVPQVFACLWLLLVFWVDGRSSVLVAVLVMLVVVPWCVLFC